VDMHQFKFYRIQPHNITSIVLNKNELLMVGNTGPWYCTVLNLGSYCVTWI